MKSAPGLRGLYPRPERRGFTSLLVKKFDLSFSLKLAAIDVIFGSSRRQIVIFDYGYTSTKELDQLPDFSYKLSNLFKATKLEHEGEKESFK